MKKLLNISSDLPDFSKDKVRRKVESVLEETEDAPTPNIAARAHRHYFLQVSRASKGLKVEYQATLRGSAASLKALVHLLIQRAQPPSETPRREVEAFREELRASKAQVELRGQVEELRRTVTRVSPPPPERSLLRKSRLARKAKSLKRTSKYTESMESEGEEGSQTWK